MKRFYIYIFLLMAGFSFVVGCAKMEDDFNIDEIINNGLIQPECVFVSSYESNYAADRLATRSLINQTTSVDSILCNFLRIEGSGEIANQSFSSVNGYTTDWGKAYLSEGSIATIPNTLADNLRSIALHPEQPYNSVDKDRISRMVGWYPRTNDVPANAQGNDVAIQYENFTSTIDRWEESENNYIGVKFTGLDGSKDIMVSNVRDGSYNNKFTSGNFFTFKHYLSAVRIYAKAERSSQDIGMWGEISEVIIMGQPTTCVVELPQTPSTQQGYDGFSEVVKWGNENAKFPIQKTYIFGEKDAGNPKNTVAEEYPIELSGNGIEKYLGYSLIKPDCPLRIQIHTNAGIYDVVMGNVYNSTHIFKAGNIYNLHLDFKTDGTVFAFLENEGKEQYYDLTKGEVFKVDSNGDGNIDDKDDGLHKNKFANCYIVYSNPANTDQAPVGTDDKTAAKTYDGFCFDASVVGNGEGGLISTGAQTFYPTNVHISPFSADVLWETSPRLITQVELLFDHVRFKVAKDENGYFKEGNAVIVVYDSEKRILWSWHIWITDKPVEISYKEGETEITILDRNLGATKAEWTDENDALETYGLYYQWGRKDPSMGPPAWNYSPINMITAPYYDYSSEEKNAAEVMRFAAPTLKDAVENPMYLILPTALTQTYYFNWLYEKIDFLWGNSATSGKTHKTIYDPCPYGYRVSGGELADLFTYSKNYSESINTTSQFGQIVTVPKDSENSNGDKSVFYFPYTGFKGVDRGLNSLVASWKYVGEKADYQSAIVSRNTNDSIYNMHRTRIYLSKARTWDELNVGQYTAHQIEDFTNRRTAAPVRCVKNVDHNRVMAYLTPSHYTVSATQNTNVTLDLFAETFESTLATAQLAIAYHTASTGGQSDEHGEGIHNEHIIGTWSLSGKQWTLNDFKDGFTFGDGSLTIIPNVGGNINVNYDHILDKSIRLILYVKSADNINKMSSTTIKIASNNYSFDLWDNDNTVFVGEPINRTFEIYGDSRPVKVEMIKKDNGTETTTDITNNLSNNNSSTSGAFDFNCSTGDFAFYNTGTQSVKFQITFENGEVIETTEKTFTVESLTLVEVNADNNFSNDEYYIIQNVNTLGYLYDEGAYMAPLTSADYRCLMKIINSGNQYKIQNVTTNDYVTLTTTWSSATLSISVKNSNSASAFTINETNTNGVFKILRQPSQWVGTYYWFLNNNSSDVGADTSDSGNNTWKIYKVTLPTNN